MTKTIYAGFILLLLIGANFTSFAAEKIPFATQVNRGDNNTYEYVQWEEGNRLPLAELDAFIKKYFVSTNTQIRFELLEKRKDKLGFEHLIYQEFIGNVKVEYAVLKFHTKDGVVHSYNGSYFTGPAKLAPEADLNNTNLQSDFMEVAKNQFLLLKPNAKQMEAKVLASCYLNDKYHELIPCLKIEVKDYEVNPVHRVYYISMPDKRVLNEIDKIHFTNVTGTAVTNYCGTVPITTDSVGPSTFYLNETGTRLIHTKNLNGSTSTSSAVEFVDNNNYWNTDSAAYDAHYGAEKTWDYYLNIHSRNSYDDLGSPLNSYVHYSTNFVNAFWNGTEMTYGDGNGTTYGPLTSTDVVAHEITHGVTEYAAGLVYSYESGALNESFSDIFGVVIDYYANPSTANFLMGDQFAYNGIPFRNMQNPNATNQPDTYQGTYWEFGSNDNGGVHTNSQVQNFWFYLLCNGGSGTNDIGDPYNITPIGMADAADIAYRTLEVYLTPNSNYAAARTYSIQSAIDLFGPCSPQTIQVTNAWHAVGVGSAFGNAVNAAFGANITNVCYLPATITFTNTSTNMSTCVWNFGDGGTSTSTASTVTHTYTTPGVYSVYLIVNGSATCQSGSDTLILSNYINISNGTGPAPASCSPAGTSLDANFGILNVQLNTINNSSLNATEGGYMDFTCTASTTLDATSQYLIKITKSTASLQYVKAYIDFNNDGIFSTTEAIANFVNSYTGLLQSVISIPSTGVVYNTPLRMRVMSSYNAISNTCVPPLYGQTEDYTVVIDNTTSIPPDANYYVLDTIVTAGATVNFWDISTNSPTSWQWVIPGGTPTSSVLQNTSAVFNTPGIYPVKLIASNSFGTDSITKNIHVVNVITFCNPSSTQTTPALSGTIYDSGGPSGYYQNYESCSLLIQPIGGCVDSIKLNLTSFSSESGYDYFRVYDGTSTAAPLIYSISGTIGSAVTITATSGSMFIRFTTDGSSTYPGFVGNWTSYQQIGIPPTADFSFTPNNPPLADTVFFTDLSSSNTTAWNWDFGDGGTSTLQNPQHIYTTPGTYTVTLIATSCLAFDTMSYTITTQASPTMVVSPLSFNVNLGCNDTVDLNLFIQNTAGGTLNWNIGGSSNVTGNNMLVWTYGVDMIEEYVNTINSINQYFTNYNLTQTNTTSPTDLQTALIGKKVLLLPESENGTSSVFTSCNLVVQNFINNGGTVIMCGDSYTASKTGILNSSTTSTGSTGTMVLGNTTTPLHNGVSTSPSMLNLTRYHDFTNANKQEVYSYNNYDVVTNIPVGLGKIIYIGFDYYSTSNDASKIIANAVAWGMQNSLMSSSVTPNNGSANAGETDTVSIQVTSTGIPGGLDTMILVVNGNDINNPFDSVFIYMNITTMPCPAFGFSQGSSCSGVVAFTDSTLNSPTTWSWNFGDGNTATTQNPVHNYTAAGTYTVTLVVGNASGIDSISHVVTINSVGGPLSASCYPAGISVNSGYGILNVQLNTINNTTSNATEGGYMDFTCTANTTLNASSQYLLKVTKPTTSSQYVKAFLDFNNDGVFSTAEEIANIAYSNAGVVQSVISIPSTGVVYNTPLRMRVMSSYSLPSTACTQPQYGQTEDYTVIIDNTTSLPPDANFYVLDTIVAVGSTVNFWDISTNGPTSWQWVIPGGTPTSSVLQNTSSVFNTPGIYPVKLIASNSFGTDSITKNIHVVNVITFCNPSSAQTTTATNGSIYDSGGPSGYYQNYENCSLLIQPLGACVDSIKLNLTSFSSESGYDYFRVYDGTSAAATLIYSISGTLGAATTITATSGSMFILFTTDGSSTYPGFAGTWTAYQQASTPPAADFSFTPNNPPLADTVFFTDLSSSNTTAWSWNFGDGGTSTLQNPQHIYTTPGTYTVTLIATSCLAYDTISYTLTVQASPNMVVTPLSFNVNLGCNDTVDLNLFIQNTAGGTLNWNVNASNNNIGNNVLQWNYEANLTCVMNSISAINQYFTNYNLYTSNTSNSATLQAELVDKDVLLIPLKVNSSGPVVASCATVIQNFVQNGGTVIVCGDETTAINTGIFQGTYVNYTLSGTVNIMNTSTPLTNGVPNSLPISTYSYYYNFTNSNIVKIGEYSSYHYIDYLPYGSGKAIFIANSYYDYLSNSFNKVLANAVEWGMQSNGLANVTPNTGSANAGETDTVMIQITSAGLNVGLDTNFIIVNGNDINNPSDTIYIYTNVSPLPCAEFNFDQPSSCSGTVLFTDTTLHNPIAWSWNFGDGGTSSLQNPQHTYAASGTYTVTLIATNAYGSDTISHVININFSTGPVATSCAMPTSSSCCGNGITNFTLGSINNTSGSDIDGYSDFTCSISATLIAGLTYNFSVTNAYGSQYHSIYLDANGDGLFSTSEILVDNAFVSGLTYNGTLTIPANALVNVPLRLRVIGSYGMHTPCSSLLYGQAEDYTIMVTTTVGQATLTAGNISLYPNPFTDLIHLSLDDAAMSNNDMVVKLFAINGQQVAEKVIKGQAKREYDIRFEEKLSKGLYVLELIADHKKYIFKLEKK